MSRQRNVWWSIRLNVGAMGQLATVVMARTYGAACRQAFREWLADGLIRRQPDSTTDGGFDGVSGEVL